MKRTLLNTLTAAAFTLTASFGTVQAGNVPESSDPIKISISEWTGQHVSAHILGTVLKEMGYSVEYVTAGSIAQHTALAEGDLHVQPEVWDNNVTDLYPKALEEGKIINVGDLGLDPREGWIFPAYMTDKCPGLPDYNALYACAQAFAAAETFPSGRVLAYPADWGTRSRDVVANIELPFQAVPAGSEGAMIAELTSAMESGEPILSMFWQPHWIFSQLEFEWVEWNPKDGDCPPEGQTRENACGFQQARTHKVVWSGFEDKWPTAYRLVQNYQLSNDVHNAAMFAIDKNGRPLDEVVSEWIADNESTWRGWIDSAMM